jgi:hypothetical protein
MHCIWKTILCYYQYFLGCNFLLYSVWVTLNAQTVDTKERETAQKTYLEYRKKKENGAIYRTMQAVLLEQRVQTSRKECPQSLLLVQSLAVHVSHSIQCTRSTDSWFKSISPDGEALRSFQILYKYEVLIFLSCSSCYPCTTSRFSSVYPDESHVRTTLQ